MKKVNDLRTHSVKDIVTFTIILLAINLFSLIGAEVYLRYRFFGISGFDLHKVFPQSKLQEISYSDDGLARFKPNQTGFLYGKPFKTNSFGLWDEKDYALRKDMWTLRIACFGESFTMGAGVSQNDNYPKILERELNTYLQHHSENQIQQVEVMNCAMPGDDLDGYLLKRIRLINHFFAPDIIIIGMTSNFFPSKQTNPLHFLFDQSQKKPTHNPLRQIQANLLIHAAFNNYENYVMQYIARWKPTKFISFLSKDARFSSKKTDTYSFLIHEAVENKTPKVIIALIRKLFYIDDVTYHRDLQENLSLSCAKYNFSFANTYEPSYWIRKNTGDLIIYPGNEHPNRVAHKIYADIIFFNILDSIRAK